MNNSVEGIVFLSWIATLLLLKYAIASLWPCLAYMVVVASAL